MTEQLGPDLLLLEKLAAGGMAEVFLARQIGYGGFEKKVAVKRILQNFAKNEDFKRMFQAEANLSAHLQHTNIAQIFSNGEVEGYLYLVMEFVDGRNARQMLARADKRKVKIPIELSCFLVSEVAKGLEYAHNYSDEKTGEKLEIVHRDMSPQNIMLGYDGAVKIVDFGIAKAASRSEGTRAGVLKGKFGYMSPEQASGMKLDRRTDIFALGIILFELITQRRLFASDDDLKTLNLVKECRVPRPSKYNPSVNPGLDRIVMKALAKEKAERYQSAGELYEDLIRLMTQRYPKFIPTDFMKFFKELFAEDIAEEKKRREKLMSEVSTFTAERSKAARPPMPSPGKDDDPRHFEATQVSNHRDANSTVITNADEDLPQSLDMSVIAEPGVVRSRPEEPGLPPPAPDFPQPGARALSFEETAYAPPPYMTARSESSSRRPLLYGVAAIGIALAAWTTLKGPSQPTAPAESATATPLQSESSEVEVPGDALPEKDVVQVPPSEIPSSEPVLETPAPSQPDPNLAQRPTEKSPEAEDARGYEEIPDEAREPASKNVVGKSAKTLPGYLNLDAVPRATEIVINGRVLRSADGEALSTPLKGYALPPGRHNIQLRSKAFDANWSGSVNVESDRIVVKDAVLK